MNLMAKFGGRKMEEPIKMKLTLEVSGKENMVMSIEYNNTNMETVKLLENNLMEMFLDINDA